MDTLSLIWLEIATSDWSFFIKSAIVLCVLFWVCCLLFIMLLRYRSWKYAREVHTMSTQLQAFIFTYVFTKNYTKDYPVADFLRANPMDERGLLAARPFLRTYVQDIRGGYHLAIRNLFVELGFVQAAHRRVKLKNGNVLNLLYAIDDLTLMGEHIAEEDGKRLIKHPNSYVFNAIAVHLIVSRGIYGLPLVFQEIQKLSYRDMMNLYQEIILQPSLDKFDFAAWLKEDNPENFNVLLLNSMVYFQLYETIPQVLQLLQRTNNQRLQALLVNAIGKLSSNKGEDLLISMFPNSGEILKVEILKVFGRASRGSSYAFLKKCFLDEQASVKIKTHAYRSIHAQRNYFPDQVLALEAALSPELSRIASFVKHPYVKYI